MINNIAKIILFSFIIGTKIYSDPYQNFLDFLENINFKKLEIIYSQVQYGNHYFAEGDLYIFSQGFYCYDDAEKQIVITQDSVVSINKRNKQVIYDDRITNDFSILDLLTNPNLNIEVDSVTNKNNMSIIDIYIPKLNLKGLMCLDSHSGQPLKISLENESTFNFNLEIGQITGFKKDNFPKVKLTNYEVIDLRE